MGVIPEIISVFLCKDDNPLSLHLLLLWFGYFLDYTKLYIYIFLITCNFHCYSELSVKKH